MTITNQEENVTEQGQSSLEEEFKQAVNKCADKIEDKLNKAAKLISEAEKLSEEYGVPFRARISPISNTYVPDSFQEQFGKLDSEIIIEICDVYSDLEPGWEYSAVC